MISNFAFDRQKIFLCVLPKYHKVNMRWKTMQINERKNSYMKTNPAFGAIKKVSCEGLYKKFPELGKELVDTFQKNPKAMEFCKKYDVSIVFNAINNGMKAVESSLYIFYDNISKSKFSRLFLNTADDKINITAMNNEFNVYESLKKSTSELKGMMMPESSDVKRFGNGVLDAHIKYADENIQNALNKKAQKNAAKLSKIEEKNAARNELKENSGKLNEAIQNLIENSK